MSRVSLAALRRLVRPNPDGQVWPTDGQLLDRFARTGESAAFDALVRRHGPLVLAVGRRVLGDTHAAEDVFQATFLVLARRAAAVRRSASVASWLFGVARRLALKARTAADRRARRERQVLPPVPPNPAVQVSWREALAVIDEELARLPEGLRAAVLLCYFEGLTQDEAARRLSWKPRTLKARLQRARRRLGERLALRGLGPPAVGAGLLVPGEPVPPNLAAAAVAGASNITAASPAVRVLADAITRFRPSTVAAGLIAGALIITLVGAGVVWFPVQPTTSTDPPTRSVAFGPRTDVLGDPLPEGAIARLGTNRFRNAGGGGVEVMFSPDSRTLASCAGGTLRLFDAATGRRLAEVHGSFRVAACSPDGKLFATAGYLLDANAKPEDDPRRPLSFIQTYEAATLKPVRMIPVLDSDVRSLTFAPDGVAVLACHAAVTTWDVAAGRELARAPLGGFRVQTVAVSPDGRTLAAGGLDGVVLWDFRAGGPLRRLRVPGGRVNVLAFAPDGKTLAAGCDPGDVWLLDVASGAIRHRLSSPENSNMVSGVAIAPDGRTVATTSWGRAAMLHLWEVETGKLLRQLEVHPSDCEMGRVTFSTDGRRLAAATSSGPRVWETATFAELEANDFAHRAALYRSAVSANGVIATCSEDHTIRLWDAATGRLKARLEHGGGVRTIALSPDGTRLASTSFDETVRVWEVPSGRQLLRLPGPGRFGGNRALRFTPDGKRLLSYEDDQATLGGDLLVRAWDLASGRAVLERKFWPEGVARVNPGDDDLKKAVAVKVLFLKLGTTTFTPDGLWLLMASAGQVRVFEVTTGREVRQLPVAGLHIVSLEVSPDGNRLLCGAWRSGSQTSWSVVTLRDLKTGREIWTADLPSYDFQALAFSADGRLVAIGVAGPQPEVRLLDAETGVVRHTIKNLGGLPRHATFAPDVRTLVTAMDDTTALVWDLSAMAKPDR